MKSAVVYWSGTGNTEALADKIFESAKANKKAGINVPHIAVKAIYFHLYNGI